MAKFIKKLNVTYLTLVVLISSSIASLNCFWPFSKSSFGPFPQIEHYSEIQKVFDACDNKTLVTFDIDSTLIMSHDFMANFEFPSTWFAIKALLKHPYLIWNRNAIEPLLSAVYEQTERFVFDPDIVRIIKQIQKQGSKTVALSLMWNGPYGNIKNMPEWRADILAKLGISFDNQFPDATFKNLQLNRGQHPCLHKGILCTNQIDKGKVLGAFLDLNNLSPAQIISFDDQKKQLISIAKECAKRKIYFAGYQMVGWKKHCGKWSTKRSLLQLDILIQDKLWLSDEEADTILSGEVKFDEQHN